MIHYAPCMFKNVTLGPVTFVRFSAEPSEDVPAVPLLPIPVPGAGISNPGLLAAQPESPQLSGHRASGRHAQAIRMSREDQTNRHFLSRPLGSGNSTCQTPARAGQEEGLAEALTPWFLRRARL